VGLAENKESFKAITEAQERIQVDLRLYEKEPGNPEAKKLRARKEGMDRSKGRLRQAAPQLGTIALAIESLRRDKYIIINLYISRVRAMAKAGRTTICANPTPKTPAWTTY
jgi:hypothetical protein